MSNTEMSKLCQKLFEHLSGYTIQQINCIGSSSFEIIAIKDNRKKTIRMGVSPDELYVSKVQAVNL